MGRFMRGPHVLLALFVIAGTAGSAAIANVPPTVEMAGAPALITQLLEAPSAKAEWFTPAFLEQVPITQVNTVVAAVRQQFGAFRSVDGNGLDYVAHLERGSVHVQIVMDHAGLIAGLLIRP